MLLHTRIGLADVIRVTRGLVIAGLVLIPCTDVYGQQNKRQPGRLAGSQEKENSKTESKKKDEPEKVNGSSVEALNIYADAANFQNNRAFELAIAEWKKLISKFPEDPIISKARHYLGLCLMEKEVPDFEAAISELEIAAKDTKSELRQESIVNLGFCNYSLAREQDDNSAEAAKYFKRCRDVMATLIKQYPESDFTDQAYFYAGEAEYAMGARDQALTWYKKLIATAELKVSPFRPDALYSMGVCYEELKQPGVALETYELLLKEVPTYRLADEVKLRKADLLVQQQNLSAAELIYKELAAKKSFTNSAYALYRQAYCVGQQNKHTEAAELYDQFTSRHANSDLLSSAILAAGQSWFKAGNKEKAEQSFEKLLTKKDAAAAEAAHWLSMSATQQRNFERGETLARAALDWSPNATIAALLQMDLADALFEQPTKQQESWKIYSDLVQADPNSAVAARANYNLAFASLQTQQYDNALRWADRFLKTYKEDPLLADVGYIGAEAALLKGDAENAAGRYSRLLDENKENPSRNLWVLRLNRARNMAGQFDKVISSLGPQVDRLPSSLLQAEAYFIVGSSYFFSNKPNEAQKQLEASLQKDAKWAQADEVMLLLAQVLAQRGQVQESVKVLERMIKEFPGSNFRSNAEFRIAQISAAEGDFNEALMRYRKALEAKPDPKLEGYAQYGKAWSLLQQQKYDEAVAELDALIGKNENPAVVNEAKLARGIALRQSGKLEAAIGALAEFLKGKPEGDRLGHGLYELGLAQTQAMQFAQAAESFERIRQEVPKYVAIDKVLYELGWALKSQQKDDDAVKVFADLVAQGADSPLVAEAHYHLAQVDYAKGTFPSAAEHYLAAVKNAGDDGLKQKALYKLGWSYYQQENYEAASERFAELAKADAQGSMRIPALFMSGECEFKRDRFADALEYYREARRELDGNADRKSIPSQVQVLTYLHGAQCLRETKSWDDMQQWLQVILDRYSDTSYMAQTMYELGYCYQNQNKITDAIKAYSDVAEKYRSEVAARARFMLGELYFGQRDFAKAIPEFQRVMYGYGGESATAEVKNWQARSAFEAGRCSEVLIADLNGDKKVRAIKIASDFYQYVVDKHAQHELGEQAKTRLAALKQL